MSGIVGIFHRDGRPANPGDLTRMVDAIAHRGPDGSAIWHDGSVGFGHRMLWTTPESLHEKLPLYRSDANVAITADARIDNRDELLNLLGIQERKDVAITDSELILEAYLKWGEQTPEKLLGDFAFAIWDGRKKLLFCARDIMGVKPFYYYLSENTFVVASEIKEMFCLKEVPRRINETRIAEFIVREIHDAAPTFYQDIVALPAAHWIIVSRDSIRKQRYWSLDPEREIRLSSDDEYAEMFKSIFFDSVGCRLRSAFPVGSHLSGGMDSSSITCVARNILNSKKQGMLHTFSCVFPGLSDAIDERVYSQSVVDMGGILPHSIDMSAVGPLVDIDQILFHLDEPHYACNLYLKWEIFKDARNSNVRIILDGTDGDTTVSYGFDYLTELTRSFRWAELLKEAKKLSRITRARVLRIIGELSVKPFVPSWIMAIIDHEETKKLIYGQSINRDFARRIGLAHYLNQFSKHNLLRYKSVRENHCRGIQMPAFTLGFELLDKAARHFDIEIRYPFFDRRLIEFCVALPSVQKFSHGWNRGIMRRALKDVLPLKVLRRIGKSDLSSNFYRNLASIDRVSLTDMLNKHKEIIDRYYDHKFYHKLFDIFLLRPESNSFEGVVVFFSYTLSRWIDLTNRVV